VRREIGTLTVADEQRLDLPPAQGPISTGDERRVRATGGSRRVGTQQVNRPRERHRLTVGTVLEATDERPAANGQGKRFATVYSGRYPWACQEQPLSKRAIPWSWRARSGRPGKLSPLPIRTLKARSARTVASAEDVDRTARVARTHCLGARLSSEFTIM